MTFMKWKDFKGRLVRAAVLCLVIVGLCRRDTFCDTWPVVLTGQIAPGTGEARFASLS